MMNIPRFGLMSRLLLNFLAVLAAATLALHAQTPPATGGPAPAGLISNPDFSQAKDPTFPDDWRKGKGLSYETENGMHYLRVTATQPGEMLMVYREVDIPPGTANLTISLRYRTTGVVRGEQNWFDARGIFHFIDTNHKNISPDPKVIAFNAPPGVWTDVSETCAVPPGAAKLVLMPSLYKVNAGILDLALVQVSVAP